MTEKTQIVKRKDLKPITDCSTKYLVMVHPKEQFLLSGGTQEQFMTEAGFALQMIEANPYLAKMNRKSIVNAVVNVALTGLTLNPELKLGYLVPRKGTLYFQSSYMGKREILLRSGNVLDIWAVLVYENDEFKIEEGTNRSITHKPKVFEERGKIIGGYWCATLINGEKPFGVMPKKELDGIKRRSEAVKAGKGSPWDTDEEEMYKKTLINRSFKSLPKTGISDSVLKALKADAELDKAIYTDQDNIPQPEEKDFFGQDRQEEDITEDAQVIETDEIPENTVSKNIIDVLKLEIKKSDMSDSDKLAENERAKTMSEEDIIMYAQELKDARLNK